MKFKRKIGRGGGCQVGGWGSGGQGGRDRRIEVLVKIQKKNWGGVRSGDRVWGWSGWM